jgi:hypothetical protein
VIYIEENGASKAWTSSIRNNIEEKLAPKLFKKLISN